MKVTFYDIETPLIPKEGIFALNQVFCLGIISEDSTIPNQTTSAVYTYRPMALGDGDLLLGMTQLNASDRIVDFNGMGFDLPVLERVLKVKVHTEQFDLAIILKLMFSLDELFALDYKNSFMPKRLYGSRKLEAYAIRFLVSRKTEFNDFSELTDEMIRYMLDDVKVTQELYHFVINHPKCPKKDVIDREFKIAKIINQQVTNGFYFDMIEGKALYLALTKESIQLKMKLHQTFKPKDFETGQSINTGKPVWRKIHVIIPFSLLYAHKPIVYKQLKTKRKLQMPGRLKGTKWSVDYSFMYQKLMYIGIQRREFNPGSRHHIIRWLDEDYNYKFRNCTAAGSMKVDTEALKNLNSSGALLARYLKVVKDRSQIGGTENSLIQSVNVHTNSIHGNVDTLGTRTHRASHCVPTNYLADTNKGSKHCKDLRIGDFIKVWSIEHARFIFTPIIALNTFKNRTIGNFTNGGLNFECTPNHKWLTQDGLKEAQDIELTDDLKLA